MSEQAITPKHFGFPLGTGKAKGAPGEPKARVVTAPRKAWRANPKGGLKAALRALGITKVNGRWVNGQ